MTIRWLIEGVCAKDFDSTLLSVDSFRYLSPYSEETLSKYYLHMISKETVCFNEALQEHESNGTLTRSRYRIFVLIAGVLQEDRVVLYLFIISVDYVSISYLKNEFISKKRKSRWYPAEAMTDTDKMNDLTLLKDTLTHAETLLHCPGQAKADVYICVNGDNVKFMF